MRVIVITHNQKDSLGRMVCSLRSQLKCSRLFVLDRCTDGSQELLEEMGEEYLVKSDGEGWEAGRVRNEGIKHVGMEEDLLMLDGDRVPSGLSENLLGIASANFDITLLGVARDHRKFFNDLDFRLNPQWGKLRNGVYTAGFFIRSTALQTIVQYNGGFLFNPVFDGMWGYEDMSMGDVAAYLGLKCGTFPRCSWVSGTFDTRITKEHDAMQHGKRESLLNKMKEKFNKNSLISW